MRLVYLIGLTGGIASGKSTIARRLTEKGAMHIDADQLSREVVVPGQPALDSIRAAFGPTVIHADGTLNRGALGRHIFSNDTARAQLNAIVHPAVRRLSDERIAAAREHDEDAVVIYDVPLLVEAAVDHPFDLIVVADAPREVRIARLIELRGLSAQDATARVDAQASDAERLAIADVVIDTSGTVASTLDQADSLWARIRNKND